MRSDEERRAERRKFEADVHYEAWRRGLDGDVAADRAEDAYYEGCSPEQCVDNYAREVARRREDRQMAEQQEQEQQQLEEQPDD